MASKTIKGLTVEIGGDTTKLGKALQDVEKKSKSAASELTDINKALKLVPDSAELLIQKQNVLTKAVDSTAQKLETLRNAEKQVQEQFERGEVSEEQYRALQREIVVTQNKLDGYQKAVKETSDQLEKVAKSSDKATEETEALSKMSGKATDETEKMTKSSDKAADKTEELAKSSDKASKEIDDVGDSAKKAESGLSAAAVAAGTFIGNLALDVLREAVSALRNIAGDIMETGMNFEASMSNVKAISGATDEELATLTATAREYGRTTSFTASESADALQYMALAGWEVEDMTAALPGVLNLAAASQMDLGQASDIVTDYLTAFGKGADYATTFVDQMAYAMSTSNMTTEMLGEAYKGCAATAHSLGYSIEETTAVLGTMANAGVKGGEAGTALNAIMTRLATDTKGCASELAKFGVEVYDESGNMKSLSSVLQGVSDVWGMFSDQEQAALAKAIAGTNHYAALQTIMSGLSDEAAESGKGFADYAEALTHAGGTAEAMAETQLDNLRGDLTKLGSAWSDLEIEIYTGANAPMRDIVQLLTNELMPALSDVVKGTDGAGVALGESLGNVLSKILKSLTDALPEVVNVAYVLAEGLLQSLVAALPDAASAAASLVKKIADAIVETIPSLLDILPGIADVVVSLIETLADVILENIPVFLIIAEKLINTIVERLPSLLQNLLSAIVNNLPMILTTLFAVLQSIVETLTNSVSELAPIIKDVVVQLTEMLIKESPTLLQGAIDLFMAILDAVPVLIEALLPLIPDIVRSVVETLADNFPEVLAVCFELFDMLQQANLDFTQKLMDILSAWFTTALTSIADWWKTLKKTATEIVNSVVDIVKGITGKMRDAGHNVLAGLIDGIVGMKAALIKKVTDIANSMIQAITKPFQIHSPSRKMAWVGQMIDEGLAEGMDDHADDPLETMKRMANSVLNEAAPLPSEIEAHHTVTMQQERTAVNTGLMEKLDRILNAIEQGKIIALDGDRIVGATIDRINNALGEQQMLEERCVI